jgi:hypothetical protein
VVTKRRVLTVLPPMLVLASAMPSSGLAASPLGTFPGCAAGADAVESQAWDGDEHIHTGTCFPMLDTLSAPVDLDVVTLLHNNNGRLTFVRWSDGSAVKQSISMSVAPGPVNEYRRTDVLRLDPARFDRSGWREVRLTSNVEDPVKGRWYTTTRFCVFVRNGKSRSDYCGGPTVQGRCGAAGWYGEYLNVFMDCRDYARRDAPVSGTWCPRLKFEHERGIATVDPHFHASPPDPGLVMYSGPGSNSWRSVCIDTRRLGNGPHVLHARTEHARTSAPVGTFAGAFAVSFTVAN